MHRIFTIDELLGNILSTFALETLWRSTSSRQTLVHCALTCTTFKNPSLDALWRNLHSFVPLLLLLPSDAVLREGSFWKINRSLDEGDWSRFNRYARRVRYLSLECAAAYQDDEESDDESDDMSDDGLQPSQFPPGFFTTLHQSFCSSNPGAILLPQLAAFKLNAMNRSDFECCPMIMALPLREAGLICEYDPDDIYPRPGAEAFFDSLTDGPSSHSIQTLSLDEMNPHKNLHLRNSCLRMLSSLRTLQEVTLYEHMFHDPDVMHRLAEMPSLQRITVHPSLYFKPPKIILAPDSGFPNLRNLDMTTCSPCEILLALGHKTVTNIRSWPTFGGQDARRPFDGYLQTSSLISQKCPHLAKLDIRFSFIPDEGHAHESIHSILSPLLSGCKQITEARLSLMDQGGSQLNLADSDYLEVSKFWAHLQSFELFVRKVHLMKPPGKARATLQGAIEPFLTYCLDLHTLVLHANFQWGPNIAAPTRGFARLNVLSVAGALIYDADDGTGGPKSVKLGSKALEYLVSVANGGTVKLRSERVGTIRVLKGMNSVS